MKALEYTILFGALMFAVFMTDLAASDDTEARTRAETVMRVQVALQDKGYEPGPTDGIWGPRTRRAVIRFQREEGLEANGRLDNETLARLDVDMDDEDGVFETIGSAMATAGKGVAKGATVAAKATAKGATVAAKKTAKASEETAEAVAEGAREVADETTDLVEGEDDWDEMDDPELRRLEARVRERLEAHPRINASDIHVKAEGDGVIRLTFDRGEHEKWNRAVAIARTVDGVEKVYVTLPERDSNR